MIITTLLCISLALIIYSALKGRKMMNVLLKFMMLSLIVMMPVMGTENVELLGLPGIPDPSTDADEHPVIISLPDASAAFEDSNWTAGVYAFLNGNQTMINNTTLVIA
jgi:hypothetical protein